MKKQKKELNNLKQEERKLLNIRDKVLEKGIKYSDDEVRHELAKIDERLQECLHQIHALSSKNKKSSENSSEIEIIQGEVKKLFAKRDQVLAQGLKKSDAEVKKLLSPIDTKLKVLEHRLHVLQGNRKAA